jgi:hypothetical protein
MKVIYVGCDVSKAEIVIRANVKGEMKTLPTVSNDGAGFKIVLREVKKLKQHHRG